MIVNWPPFCLGHNVLNTFKMMKSWVWLYIHYLTYVHHWINACITNGTTWFTWSFILSEPMLNYCYFIWTNAGILLIGTLGANFSEIWIKLFEKKGLKMIVNWPPFCLGLNVLNTFKMMKSWVWLYRHYLTYVHHWIHACITNGTTWFTWSFILYFIFSHTHLLTCVVTKEDIIV